MKEGVFRFYFLCTIYICICNSFHTVIRLVICVSDLKWFYNDGATEGQVWNTFRKIEIVFFSREEVFIQSFPFWVIDILYLVYVNDWIVSEVILYMQLWFYIRVAWFVKMGHLLRWPLTQGRKGSVQPGAFAVNMRLFIKEHLWLQTHRTNT